MTLDRDKHAIGLNGLMGFCNSIGSVIISVDCEFDPQSGQTKHYKIDICCFSPKHATLRRISKELLARNRDNVSVVGDMSIRGLLFQ